MPSTQTMLDVLAARGVTLVFTPLGGRGVLCGVLADRNLLGLFEAKTRRYAVLCAFLKMY